MHKAVSRMWNLSQPTKKTEAVNEPVAQASDDLPFSI